MGRNTSINVWTRKGKDELIQGVRDTTAEMSIEMKKAMAAFDKASDPRAMAMAGGATGNSKKQQMDLIIKTEAAVIKLAKAESTSFKNIRSSIDGAKESAKDFTDSLIISTDVDKPLSTFRQISSALGSYCQQLIIHTFLDRSLKVLLSSISDNKLYLY